MEEFKMQFPIPIPIPNACNRTAKQFKTRLSFFLVMCGATFWQSKMVIFWDSQKSEVKCYTGKVNCELQYSNGAVQ